LRQRSRARAALTAFFCAAAGCGRIDFALNQTPVLAPVAGQTLMLGGMYVERLAASDADGDQLLFSCDGACPSGLVVEPDSGLVSWAPTALQLGDFQPVFAVSDGRSSARMEAAIAVVPSAWLGARRLGGAEHEYCFPGVVVDRDGNLFVAGRALGPVDGQPHHGGFEDVLVAKYDASGTLLRTQLIGGAGAERAHRMTLDDAGDLYVAARTYSPTFDGIGGGDAGGQIHDIALVKYDNRLDKIWSARWGVAGTDEQPFGVAVDRRGTVYVSGHVAGSLLGTQPYAGGTDAFVLRIDATTGALRSAEQFGGPGDDASWGVLVDAEDSLYVHGYVSAPLHGVAPPEGIRQEDAFVAKYDADGAHLWTRVLGAQGHDTISGLTGDDRGGVVFGGNGEGSFADNPDHVTYTPGVPHQVIGRFDGAGNLQWLHQFAEPFLTDSEGLVSDGTGNTYLQVRTQGSIDGQPYAGGFDIALIKHGRDGDRLWTRMFGGANDEFSGRPAFHPGYGLFLGLSTTQDPYLGTTGFGAGQHDIVLSKFDPAGNPL
jgi:hypothetical protein